MPDYAATPRYDAPKAATPVPVSSDREHEVADISARTTSRLAIGMAAATMALAGTVAVMHSDSVSKTVSNLLANANPEAQYDNDEYKFMDDEYKLLDDDLIQKNWPGLTCENADDDSQDWPAETGVHHCVEGDAYTCAEWGNLTSSKNQWEQCSSTCNSTLDSDIESLIEKYGSPGYKDHMNYTSGDKSWYVVCAWQGITELPKMCNDMFTPTLPTAASNNHGKTVNDSSLQNMYFNGTVDWDSCNVHAFCYTCTEDDGSLNKYCEAVLQKYNYDGYKTPSSIRDLVYDDMEDYWCNTETLDAIEKGSFKEKLQADNDDDYIGHVIY